MRCTIETMRSTLVSVSLLALCAVPGLAATKEPAAPPVRHLPVPTSVPADARQALRIRMRQHATSTQNLLRAGVLLDRPTIKLLADRIAGEQTFARAAISNLEIPGSVIVDGEAFTTAAQELALAAATGSNDDVLADRFAALTRTCVSCHGAYLHPPRKRPPVDYPAEPL